MKSKPIFLFGVFSIFVILLFLNSFNVCFADSQITKIKIISDTAQSYISADINSEKNSVLHFGETYDVISTQNSFYEIYYNETPVFVLCCYCQNLEVSPLQKTLDTNATLISNSFVYEKNNESFEQVNSIELGSGTRVKLLSGTEKENKYSLVTFEYQNQYLTYYIPSKNINPDGFPLKTVIAIMLIIVCSSILLIIYDFYKKIKNK